MNELEKMASIDRASATYLLYSDIRVDLLQKAVELSEYIYRKYNIDFSNILEHPDVKYIFDIKIDDVRELISLSSESSYTGKKIYILELKGMKKEASNALLKLIEEPPINTYFILLTNTLNILETIKSRAIKIYIKPKLYDIDSRIYNIFDGNEKYIDEYIKNDIKIDDYKCDSLEHAYEGIETYFNSDDINIYIKLRYELSLVYVVSELKYNEEISKILFINKLSSFFSKEREKADTFLKRIIILATNKISHDKYIRLIKIKNSIRNNVSIRTAIYVFLSIIGGFDVQISSK